MGDGGVSKGGLGYKLTAAGGPKFLTTKQKIEVVESRKSSKVTFLPSANFHWRIRKVEARKRSWPEVV